MNAVIDSPRVTPLRAGLSAGLFVFLFYAVAFNTQPHGWLSWYRLATSGRQTLGTITGRQPELHQRCCFAYVVDSIRYEGADEGCRLEVGQTVILTYLPSEPTFATHASPAKNLAFSILAPLSISVVAGSGVAAQLRRRRRRLLGSAQ